MVSALSTKRDRPRLADRRPPFLRAVTIGECQTKIIPLPSAFRPPGDKKRIDR